MRDGIKLMLLQNGAVSIADTICDCIRRHRQVAISSAFVTVEGLRLIQYALLEGLDDERLTSVIVLTGTYQCFTEPKALEMVLDLSEKYGPKVALRIFNAGTTFHKKLYLFRDYATRGAQAVVIGSANLTSNMQTADEACLLMSAPSPNALVKQLWQSFEQDVEDSIHLPDDGFLTDYRQRYDRAHELRKQMPRPPVRRESLQPAPRERRIPSVFLHYTIGTAGPKERQMVRQQTNWDIRQWDWYCFDDASAFKQLHAGDRLLVVDYGRGDLPLKAHLWNIRAKMQGPKTAGAMRHFVAYSCESQKSIRLDAEGRALAAMLREAKVLPSRVRRLDEFRTVPKAAVAHLMQWVKDHQGGKESQP
jgi:HKD family nuclease